MFGLEDGALGTGEGFEGLYWVVGFLGSGLRVSMGA